jgi:hypothetical protein
MSAKLVETWTKDCGSSARTFQTALIWCVADAARGCEEAGRAHHLTGFLELQTAIYRRFKV